jgi:hypothetical protein
LRLRDRFAIFAQSFEMQFDGLADVAFNFFGGFSGLSNLLLD